MGENPKKTEQRHPIVIETQKFVSALDSLALTLNMSMESLDGAHTRGHDEYNAYVKQHADSIERDGKTYIRIRSHESCHDFGILRRGLDRLHAAYAVVPQSFLVALVSRYDAFLGGIVRALFRARPEMLKSSERTLTYLQLTEFGSLQEAREFVLEKELETLLRKSHVEQFEWLEKKFDIQLRKELAAWGKFVELTERRNLFVHADGVASNQYIDNCRSAGISLDKKINAGFQLG